MRSVSGKKIRHAYVCGGQINEGNAGRADETLGAMDQGPAAQQASGKGMFLVGIPTIVSVSYMVCGLISSWLDSTLCRWRRDQLFSRSIGPGMDLIFDLALCWRAMARFDGSTSITT